MNICTIKLLDKNIQTNKSTLELIPYFAKKINDEPNNILFDVDIHYNIFMQILDYVSFNTDIDYEKLHNEMLMLGFVDLDKKIMVNVRGKIFYCDESILDKFTYFESLMSGRWDRDKIFLDINPEAFENILTNKYDLKWKNVMNMLGPKNKISYQKCSLVKILTIDCDDSCGNKFKFSLDSDLSISFVCLNLEFKPWCNTWVNIIESYIIKNINVDDNKINLHGMFVQNSAKYITSNNNICIPINIMSNNVSTIEIILNNHNKLKINSKKIDLICVSLSIKYTNEIIKNNTHWISEEHYFNYCRVNIHMPVSGYESINKIIIMIVDSNGLYVNILNTVTKIKIISDSNIICDSDAASLININNNNFVRNREYILVCYDSDINYSQILNIEVFINNDLFNNNYTCCALLQITK